MSVKVTDFCSVFSTAECGKDLEQNSNTERSGSLRISNIYLTFLCSPEEFDKSSVTATNDVLS